MYRNLFIHLPVDEHLDCFHFGYVRNNPAISHLILFIYLTFFSYFPLYIFKTAFLFPVPNWPEIKFKGPMAVVLNVVVPQGICANTWNIFDCHSLKGEVLLASSIEPKDAVSHPTMHRTVPTTKTSTQNVNSTQIKKQGQGEDLIKDFPWNLSLGGNFK